MKKKYSIVTQLQMKNNAEIIAYFEEMIPSFSYITRKVWHVINHGGLGKVSKFNTHLQRSYGITKRTANSIIKMVQGRHNAIKELKAMELAGQKRKRKSLEKKLEKLEKRLLSSKEKASRNELSKEKLIEYRNLKRKVVALKQKKDKILKSIAGLEKAIKTNRFKLCFGTKKLAKKEAKEAFLLNRDRQMAFVGSKDETAGNQMLQLSYDKKLNQFIIKLRKDFCYKGAKGNERYVFGKCYFNHHKEKIVNILKSGSSPLAYQLIRKNERYSLICTFEIEVSEDSLLTRSTYGTIGIDFNKGFLAIAETNEYGHLVSVDKQTYRYGKGTKTKSDLEQVINQVIQRAIKTGKDIVIEDLSFIKKKAGLLKSKKKSRESAYNTMLSTLAYRKYTDLMENIAFRNAVTLVKINPYNTSKIARQQFCNPMKLNIHTGAAFVIARRGQGFCDELKENIGTC